MSIFGTQDTRMTGSPAAMLLKEGSAEFQQLIKQSTGNNTHVEALSSATSLSDVGLRSELIEVGEFEIERSSSGRS